VRQEQKKGRLQQRQAQRRQAQCMAGRQCMSGRQCMAGRLRLAGRIAGSRQERAQEHAASHAADQ